VINYLWQRRRQFFLPVSVCLSVSKITEKHMHGFGWNVACRQLPGHGRTHYLLSPIWIIFPLARTGLLSLISYKCCYAEFCVGRIPRIRIGGPPLQQGMVLKWFYSLNCQNTFVRGTCALPSPILVVKCLVNCYSLSNAMQHIDRI